MFGTKRARLGSIVAVAGTILGLWATVAVSPLAWAKSLSRLVVERNGDTRVIALDGMAQASYEASRAAQPRRIVVDLDGVKVSAAERQKSVFDGLVDEISLADFQAAPGKTETRLEVTLAADADYDIVRDGDRLLLELRPAAKTAKAAPEGEGSDPWAEPPAVSAGPADAAAPSPAAAAPAKPATKLVAVEPQGSADGTVVRLRTDGSISSVESSVMSGKPARLVIDLAGIKSSAVPAVTSVAGSQVQRVRVGAHGDKMRVVLDAADAKVFDHRQIVPVADGIVIAIGGGAQVEQAVAAAQSSAPAAGSSAPAAPAQASAAPAAPAKGPAQVQKVELASGPDADRVVVTSDRAVEYRVTKPDADTVLVTIPRAKLDPSVQPSFNPPAGGPVGLISAFEQPGAKTPEVRVAIRRAKGLEPAVQKDGAMLTLGFAHQAGAVAAQPVPGDSKSAAAAGKAMADAAKDVPAPKDAKPGKAQAKAGAPPAAAEPSGDSIGMLEEGGLLDGKEYVGRRISLDFKDVDVRDVLRLIADVSDLNIIAGDEVSGNVTIRLVDVPWDQALDVILLTKGLGFVRVGNVLRIAPGETLKSEEEARLQERRAKEKLEDLVVKLQPVNYANVKEVSTLVKRLLTPRGTVDIDERTNTVIIKDIASVIDESTALIKAIDTQTPQVMIEARIVEATLDFSQEIGLEWGVGTQPSSDDSDFTIGGVKPVTTPGSGFPYNNANNVVVTNPITLTPAGLINLGSFLLDNRFNVDVRLAAAELNGEGKIISSPRVVTLDNREAKIEQGLSIPFQTFQNGDAQLEFIDAVLSLKVTPHITADRSIIMAVKVSKNAPDTSVSTPTGSPAIAKNEAKTETLVKDGQTLVLGGIYVIDTSHNQQRVPGFWKLPILGNAFRNNKVTDNRKELLIFVQPSVVAGPQAAS